MSQSGVHGGERRAHVVFDAGGHTEGRLLEIPMGARILAVVEYYDALTSGWPGDVITSERERLYDDFSSEAALEVLYPEAGKAQALLPRGVAFPRRNCSTLSR